jgi:very-short-patch-repair endonuclease
MSPRSISGSLPSPRSSESEPLRGGSGLEIHLALSMRAAGLPEPEREYRFHPTRKWRLDFAWPVRMLAVEVEGGVYRGGGHSSVAGIKRDIEKSNALALGGWRLLRFHGDQVRSGEATEIIKRALEV